jgi:hypothetical protein
MKKSFYFFCLLLANVLGFSGFASALTGNILATSTSHTAQSLVCKDAACLVGTSGKLNWLPTTGSGVTAVSIDDSLGLSGNVWGNEMGWINLKPSGQGVTVNQTTGVLSGYAWSSVCGWINFAPTSYGVSIVTETAETSGGAGTGVGKFDGYAWCGGVKFQVARGALLNASLQYLQVTLNDDDDDERNGYNALAFAMGFSVSL